MCDYYNGGNIFTKNKNNHESLFPMRCFTKKNYITFNNIYHHYVRKKNTIYDEIMNENGKLLYAAIKFPFLFMDVGR